MKYFLIIIAALGGFLGYGFWLEHEADKALAVEINKLLAPRESNYSEYLTTAFAGNITLSAGEDRITVPQKLSGAWLEQFYRNYTKRIEYRVKSDAVVSYLTEIAPRFRIAPVNARFASAENSIVESVPSFNGQSLNIQGSFASAMRAFSNGQSEVELATDAIEPEISLRKLEDMGITALLNTGQSSFKGSGSERIHNIKTGASKFDHTIIQSGEEFSFNGRVGEVDAANGYLPGLVIKGNKLIPEYGGGLCQVSTTMFRAAMNAGLAIIERRPHSLPVRFYNPQGFDATVYPGAADLRFRNDTQYPILIQANIKGSEIAFEFFGTPDGRTVDIKGPIVYESNPDGSLKAVLNRTVTYADGSSKKDQFWSNYKSPGLFEVVRNPLE